MHRGGSPRNAPDPRGVVELNGQVVDPGQALLPAFDRGFLFGDGVFESLRTYGGRPFRLDAHLARLEAGLRLLGIVGVPPPAELAARITGLLGRSGLSEAYLRITITRGPGRGLEPDLEAEPTVLIAALPLRVHPDTVYAEGISAILLWPRHSADQPPPTVKSTSYQRAVLARLELARRGAQEGFFLDERGHVTEGATSNLFVVRGGALVTPPASACLAGVTRAEILSIAAEVGIPASEEPLPSGALSGADELFVTSSLAEVLPVVRLEGRIIGTGRPGPVTLDLLTRYRRRAWRSTRSGEGEASGSP